MAIYMKSAELITNPYNILKELVQFYLTSFKSETYLWSDEIISLKNRIAEYDNYTDTINLRDRIRSDLESSIMRIFQDDPNLALDIKVENVNLTQTVITFNIEIELGYMNETYVYTHKRGERIE